MRGQVYSRRLSQPPATAKSLCSVQRAHLLLFSPHLLILLLSPLATVCCATRNVRFLSKAFHSKPQNFHSASSHFHSSKLISAAFISLSETTFFCKFTFFLWLLKTAQWGHVLFFTFSTAFYHTGKNKIYASICISKPVRKSSKVDF
jgi:hypothetical protein